MKKVTFLLILLASFSDSFSQAAPDLNGLWADSNSASFQNAYIIIAQEGDKVHFSHYLEFNGKSMVEYGSGKIKGREVKYKVKVSKAIPGWATKGYHNLVLSADGKTLRGSYKDNTGNSGPLVFKKLR